MCNLHWCYTFCTCVTLFALVLNLNCTALSQSESSNFSMYIISRSTGIYGYDCIQRDLVHAHVKNMANKDVRAKIF